MRNPGSTTTKPQYVAGRDASPSQNNAYKRPVASDHDQYRGNNRVSPYNRPPIDHGRPGRFFDHGCHYYGYRVHSLPPHHTHHDYWGRRYYCYDGIYYHYHNGYYYVCRPPYGYYFDCSLYYYVPFPCRFVYYSYAARQYDMIDDNWRTIAEQNEIIARNNATIAQQNLTVAQLKSQNLAANEAYNLARKLGLVQSFAYADATYYYDDGVFFIINGAGQYETIIPPAGALVESLPDDYEVVTLVDGREYYRVDDTIYRVVVVEGQAYFEVLGQLQNYKW